MVNKALGILIDITKNRPSSYALKFIHNTRIQKRYYYNYHNGDDDTYLKFEGNEANLVAGGKSLIKLDYNNNSNDKIM